MIIFYQLSWTILHHWSDTRNMMGEPDDVVASFVCRAWLKVPLLELIVLLDSHEAKWMGGWAG